MLGTIPVGQSASLIVKVTPTVPETIVDAASVQADQVNVTGTPSSSVSTVVVTPPGTFSFSSSAYSAANTAGILPITIKRTGGYQDVVTVHLATVPGGNAVAGADFVPLSQTLVFGQGVLSQTVNLNVLANPNNRTNVAVALQLSSPTNGASLTHPPPRPLRSSIRIRTSSGPRSPACD